MKIRYKALIYLTISILLFFIVCAIFGKTDTEFNAINGFNKLLNTGMIIMIIPACFIFPLFIFLMFYTASLNSISSDVVGDGQHGKAQFMSDAEKNKAYKKINIWDPIPGWIIGFEKGKFLLETTDNNVFVLAPPGGGKTRRLVMLNIIHLMFVGGFFTVTDIKNKTIKLVKPIAKVMGYRILYFNARNPLQSNKYNFLSIVNKYNDKVLMTDDPVEKIVFRSRAQRYAKILAKQIIGIVLKSPSGAGQNQFFYDTAEGILAALILLISQYADEGERHILSVFKIIQEQAQQDEEGVELNKTKLFYLLQKLPENDKAKWMASPGAQAEIRVALNSFSTALTSLLSFIDDEIEQMICAGSDFDAEDLINEPKVGIVFNIPEENKTRHFLLSLFINTLTQQLIELADDEENGELPFDAKIFIDEMGTAPPIDNIEETMTGSRERKILLMNILHTMAQLQLKYGDKRAKIILNACKTFIFSGLGAMQTDDSEQISKAMGKKTIKTGGVQRKSNSTIFDNSTLSESMMGAPLMEITDIMKLDTGDYIVLKTGANPLRTYLGDYTDYKYGFEILPLKNIQINNELIKIKYLDSDVLERKIDVINKVLNFNFKENSEATQITIDENFYSREENENNKSSEDYFDDIRQFFMNKQSLEGIQLLADSKFKESIKLLYRFQKAGELAFETYENYKKFLKNNL
jgi:Type IV secretory pathway, VirD4 components